MEIFKNSHLDFSFKFLFLLCVFWVVAAAGVSHFGKDPEPEPPNDWDLAYLHSPTNGLCFVVVMQGAAPRGVTQINCIEMPAGEFVEIE